MPLPDLLDALRRTASLPKDRSEATPPQAYTSLEFLELELDRIFNHEWICVGRRDEFTNPGDFRVVTVGRDEVIILRGRDGVLRALSNICRHRMMSLLTGAGNLKGKITCPYHAWTYNLDGQLSGALHMSETFDVRSCRLPQFAIEEWEGWLYVNLDPESAPLGPRLSPIRERLANFNLNSYQTLFRVDEVWNTNWKILFQNFMEPYHVFVVHRATVEHALPTRLSEVQEGGPGFCLYKQGRIPGVAYEYGEPMQNPNSALTEEEENSVFLFGAFPSHVVSVSAERTFWLSLMPIGVDKVHVFWGVDVHPDAMPDGADREQRVAALKASFQKINDEDKPMIAAVARNAKALAAEPGRLSHMEYTLLDFQRYLSRMLSSPQDVDTAQ